MAAPMPDAGPRPATATRGRLTTIAVMAVVAVIIVGVAVLANQPPASASNGNFNPVSVSGVDGNNPLKVGQPVPDFTVTTTDGKTVKLSDLKGKPVWLTFGASWCQPCRAENPDIQATVQKESGTDLVVLGIFWQEDGPAVKSYADRLGLTYLKAPDPAGQVATLYRILGIPTHFFIDRSGVLRQLTYGGLSPAEMEAAVKEILQ